MRNKSISIGSVLIGILFVSLACSMPFSGQSSSDVKMTESALNFQGTALALRAQQATLDAALNNKNEPVSQPTEAPPPVTATPLPPTEEPTEKPTDAPPTPEPTLDIKTRIKKANVAIFEDIWGYSGLSGNRRVSMAVDHMGFSGGKVINTGDAYGTFKELLTGSTKWDLIVVSAESREGMKGEFWDYIEDQVRRGAGLVAEVYNLDNIGGGRISNLLQECGVGVQSDWYRQDNYDQLDYSILLLQPDHPIFNTPNSGISLVTPNIYWVGDAGDLLRLKSSGDAQMLAGLYQGHKSDYGVLASCMQERVIFQTFGTHDYRQDQTVPLWENMMTYALTNHFKYMDEQK
ncbi:MAG: PT domain-containing protein [Anaerolineae bacterium]|nr:PT domain-containing protein [Anaerolineae bacterium]